MHSSEGELDGGDEKASTTNGVDTDEDGMEVDESNSCVEPGKPSEFWKNCCETGVKDFDITGTEDALDQEKVCDLLKASNAAGKKVEGKNIMLLIGGTGAGKAKLYFGTFLSLFVPRFASQLQSFQTTTTLYFAGTEFEEVEVHGREHL